VAVGRQLLGQFVGRMDETQAADRVGAAARYRQRGPFAAVQLRRAFLDPFVELLSRAAAEGHLCPAGECHRKVGGSRRRRVAREDDVTAETGCPGGHRGGLAEVRRRDPADHERVEPAGDGGAEQELQGAGLAAGHGESAEVIAFDQQRAAAQLGLEPSGPDERSRPGPELHARLLTQLHRCASSRDGPRTRE
jgi:hypothetical protein